MRYEILLVVQVLLVNSLTTARYNGKTCDSDSGCLPWMSCIDNTCQWCGKPGTLCGEIYSPCCKGFVCQKMHDNAYKNASICLPESCRVESDCPQGFGCSLRLGKCEICKKDGEICSLPFDDEECCSGFCYLPRNTVNGRGICKNLFTTTTTTTTLPPPVYKKGQYCYQHHHCGYREQCNSNYQCAGCQFSSTICVQDQDCCSGQCRFHPVFKTMTCM